MSDPVKTCAVCGVAKPNESFRKYNAYYSCKTCRDCEKSARVCKRKSTMSATTPAPAQQVTHQSQSPNFIDLICYAIDITNTMHDATNSNQVVTCCICGVAKQQCDFYVRINSGIFDSVCIECRHAYERNNRYTMEYNEFMQSQIPQIPQKCCRTCEITKTLSEFYRVKNRYDSMCKRCRLDYNRTSRYKRKYLDGSVGPVNNDVDSDQLRSNVISQMPIILTEDAPSQNTNPSVAAQSPNCPLGLKKFSHINLIGTIAKILHSDVPGLKCIYPDECVADIMVWKSQVAELYALQNNGVAEPYRHNLFDYVRAAHDLKNLK